jgi:general stress protein YciG
MKKQPQTVAEAGRKGGLARAKSLTAEERSAIAKKAVQAREAKRKTKQK